MDNDLVIGVSGVRGVVGKSLTPELLTRLGAAFGTYMKAGRIVVGRDTRVSGNMIKHAVFSGLLSTGCQIIDLDICTTPSCALMIEELKADGGIVISGSHNPIEWNALKFFKSNGIFLNEKEGQELLNIYYQGNFKKVMWNGLKETEVDKSALRHHINRILKITDVDLIKKAKLKVAIDCCNGAGAIITPFLLNKLGCKVKGLNCKPNGLFPHNPEPNFENLQDLCKLMKKGKFDVGFAQDADADRIAIIAENGAFIGEENSLGLACDYILQKAKGPVVTNISTTRAIEDISGKYGCKVIRTKVGEVYVAEKMIKEKSVIGGEGNGGVIDPRVHFGRDSLVGIVITLQYIAETKRKLSDIVKGLPKYAIKKDKIALPNGRIGNIVKKLPARYKGEDIDYTDGIKVIWKDKNWISFRSSNTEPVIRIIAEAETSAKADKIIKEGIKNLKDLIK